MDEKKKKPANQHRITPLSVLDAVKEFMPVMALDPCWNEYALTDAEFVCDGVTADGLTADWHAAVQEAGGGVFVNPPWGDPTPWIEKIVAESNAHQNSDPILLWLLCHPETATGKAIWENANRICIWGRRVNHPEPPIDAAGVLLPGGEAVLSAAGSMWPTWLAYFGRDTERFEEVFSKYGVVLWGWNCQRLDEKEP